MMHSVSKADNMYGIRWQNGSKKQGFNRTNHNLWIGEHTLYFFFKPIRLRKRKPLERDFYTLLQQSSTPLPGMYAIFCHDRLDPEQRYTPSSPGMAHIPDRDICQYLPSDMGCQSNSSPNICWKSFKAALVLHISAYFSMRLTGIFFCATSLTFIVIRSGLTCN